MLRWIIFFLCSNILLFIPVFLAHGGTSSFLPMGGIRNIEVEGLLSILFLNHNLNPFRIAAEWTLVLLIIPFLPNKNKTSYLVPYLLSGMWIIFMCFQLYYAIMHYLYGSKPQLLNEWVLIREVLPVFTAGMGIAFEWVFAALFLVLILIFFLLQKIIRFTLPIQNLRHSNLVWSAIGLFILASGWRYRHADIYDLRLNCQFLVPRMVHAISSKDIKKLDNIFARSLPYAGYDKLKLRHPPNLYLIFIESYGAVPFLSQAMKDTFESYSKDMEHRLTTDGWKTASTWSLAPIKGGRSWLSFTSAITGIHIEDQLAYNKLIDLPGKYPHLVHFLNQMGYSTHRINTMQNNDQTDKHIPYEKIGRFHGFDTWTLFQDIPYIGISYNSMGGLPDQYALEYVFEEKVKGKSGPHFVFFITLDSHAPWYPPPIQVEDYKSLDTITSLEPNNYQNLDADILDRYRDCMFYELGFLEQFIRKNGTSNDMFILIGDHQPPAMEHLIWDQINDFAVPLHIIQKQENVQKDLLSLDFSNGMIPSVQDSISWNHEGLYSLIAHLLSKCYGAEGSMHVPVKKHGT